MGPLPRPSPRNTCRCLCQSWSKPSRHRAHGNACGYAEGGTTHATVACTSGFVCCLRAQVVGQQGSRPLNVMWMPGSCSCVQASRAAHGRQCTCWHHTMQRACQLAGSLVKMRVQYPYASRRRSSPGASAPRGRIGCCHPDCMHTNILPKAPSCVPSRPPAAMSVNAWWSNHQRGTRRQACVVPHRARGCHT